MPIEKMIDPGRALTEEDLSRVEEAIGVELPTEYRAFLLAHNGGRPEPDAFNFGDKPGSIVDRFYRVDAADPLADLVTMAIEWRANVPADLMAIADDAGGSVVCIGVRGKRRGRVYFWSLEDAPHPPDPTSYEGVWEVAPSFDAFLASFHEAQP